MKGSMRSLKSVSWSFLVVTGLAIASFAQDATPASPDPASAPATVTQLPAPNTALAPSSFDQVMDRVIEREHFFVAQMKHAHPLVETYIQDMKADKEMGAVPASD